MRVRMNIGRYAGEIRDLPFLAAKGMVDAGRAEPIDCLHLFPQAPVAAVPEVKDHGPEPVDRSHRRAARNRRR